GLPGGNLRGDLDRVGGRTNQGAAGAFESARLPHCIFEVRHSRRAETLAPAADLLDENGNPRHLRQGLIVDSFATFGAGLAGTSSGTAYIESIAGIDSGGRTGMTSVFTA